jgi:hypothetical protein
MKTCCIFFLKLFSRRKKDILDPDLSTRGSVRNIETSKQKPKKKTRKTKNHQFPTFLPKWLSFVFRQGKNQTKKKKKTKTKKPQIPNSQQINKPLLQNSRQKPTHKSECKTGVREKKRRQKRKLCIVCQQGF